MRLRAVGPIAFGGVPGVVDGATRLIDAAPGAALRAFGAGRHFVDVPAVQAAKELDGFELAGGGAHG